MAELIDGKKIAEGIYVELEKSEQIKKALAVLCVGENAASKSFIARKKSAAERLHIPFQMHAFSESVSGGEFIKKIEGLNHDHAVGGIIIQLPLPKAYDREKILQTIVSAKDVDALGSVPRVLPPTVGAFEEILKALHIDFQEKTVAVIGKGFLVGSPITKWLQKRAKKIIWIDYGDDFSEIKIADIVVVGVGKPGIIIGEHIKKGAVLIDFGSSLENEKIRGDIDMRSCESIASFITPTPGGTGPVVVAKLFQNFYILNQD